MNQIPERFHPTWHKHVQPLFDDVRMEYIKQNIVGKGNFYPEKWQIFRVFEIPLDKIKVVILGQDPYPNGRATGLAFGIDTIGSYPYSLTAIKNEIHRTIDEDHRYFKHHADFEFRHLEHWWKQGILLLNTALTVERGVSGSHLKDWRWFTEEIIKIVSLEITPIWLLWGAKAQGFINTIRDAETFKVNDILTAPHPAAEAYNQGTFVDKFTGCDHFNKCNKLLTEKEQSIIYW